MSSTLIVRYKTKHTNLYLSLLKLVFYFQHEHSKIDDKVMRIIEKYIKDNIVSLWVYYKDPYLTKVIRDEKFSTFSFISNFGGLLGLFQGASFISLLEIIYFILMWIKTKMSTRIEVSSEENDTSNVIQIKPIKS